jgi:hypothetical protein
MTTDPHPRMRVAVIAIAVGAIALRWWLALAEAPGGGDPSYSYAYRAVLLLDGQWDALWLMWHPPGMPITMALISFVTWGWLTPWWAGIVVTLLSTGALVIVVDGLLRHRLTMPSLRLAAAALIGTQESLVHWARLPLTEPVFLLLLMLAVRAVDRQDVRPAALIRAGVFVGVSSVFRFEGLIAVAGLAAGAFWVTRRLASSFTVLAGGVIGASWMLVNPGYVLACVTAQGVAYTVPVAAAGGWLAFAGRVPRVIHHAFTEWLPNVLLLPYWMLAAVGAWAQREVSGRRLNRLLLSVVGPIALAIAWSVMHKRTGAFLVPAVVVWVVLALDAWVVRGAEPPRRLVMAALLVCALCAMDVVRLAYAFRGAAPVTGFVQREVAILESSGVPRGEVFAFGQEPSLYGLLGWPVRFEYWNRRATSGARYVPGAPAAFVEGLRAGGTRYLVFVVSGDEVTAYPHSWTGAAVRSEDLLALVREPGRYGLTPVGDGPSIEGEVHVFSLGR